MSEEAQQALSLALEQRFGVDEAATVAAVSAGN